MLFGNALQLFPSLTASLPLHPAKASVPGGATWTTGQTSGKRGGEGLAQMCGWLIATSGGKPEDIHVAIEVPHGGSEKPRADGDEPSSDFSM